MFAPYACSNLNSINSLPALNAPDFQWAHIIGTSIFLRALLFFISARPIKFRLQFTILSEHMFMALTLTPRRPTRGLLLLLPRPISESKHQYGLSSHIVATTANLVRGLPGGPAKCTRNAALGINKCITASGGLFSNPRPRLNK